MAERKPITRAAAIDEDIVAKAVEKLLNSSQFMDRMINIICEAVAKQFDEKIKVLEEKVDRLSQEVVTLKEESYVANDMLEQYSRRNSLRIFGLPHEKGEDTDKLIVKLCKDKLNVHITEVDIDCSHRLPAKDGFCPPLIVKFCRRSFKNMIYHNKSKLKNSKIVIREDLTRKRMQLFNKVKTLHGPKNVWTSDGAILVKTGSGVKKMVCEGDLQKLDHL